MQGGIWSGEDAQGPQRQLQTADRAARHGFLANNTRRRSNRECVRTCMWGSSRTRGLRKYSGLRIEFSSGGVA
eukprot:831919-Pyramimonas_sp.AAC.2